MIFRVEYVGHNKLMEKTVEAEDFATDPHNNVLFYKCMGCGEPACAFFPAGRIVSIQECKCDCKSGDQHP